MRHCILVHRQSLRGTTGSPVSHGYLGINIHRHTLESLFYTFAHRYLASHNHTSRSRELVSTLSSVSVGLLFFTLGFLVVPARAQVTSAVQYFDEGNQLFFQGDYRSAVTSYEQAISHGYISGALFYNMGNTHYRLDEIGQAIRYYEKARRLIPDSEELLHNLAIAQSRTVDRFSQLPEPFWEPAWRAFIGLFGVNGLFYIGLVFYLAAIVLLGYGIWTGERNPWRRRFLSIFWIAGLLLLSLAFYASFERILDRQAVIVAQEVLFYEVPQDATASDLALHEGLLVDVLREQDNWAEIRLPNGTTGWIDKAVLAEV